MWFLVAPKAQGCPPKTWASARVRGLWPGLNSDTTWQPAFPTALRLGPPGSALESCGWKDPHLDSLSPKRFRTTCREEEEPQREGLSFLQIGQERIWVENKSNTTFCAGGGGGPGGIRCDSNEPSPVPAQMRGREPLGLGACRPHCFLLRPWKTWGRK